jgi:hypothetical protein
MLRHSPEKFTPGFWVNLSGYFVVAIVDTGNGPVADAVTDEP